MEYKSFKEAILHRLSEEIPEPKYITVQSVRKNNGQVLDGLVIMENGINISPTLYLNHYYQTYLNGEHFSAVYQKLVQNYEKNKTTKSIDVTFFTDFEKIRPHIAVKLIHYEKNMGLFKEKVPHIPFLDLAIVFYCTFSVDPDIGNATILIDESHLSLWEKSVEELLPIAMENTKAMFPPKFLSIGSLLQDLAGNEGYPTIPFPEDPLYPMYVLTNDEGLFGASCITYEGLLLSYADRFQSGLYILPSSIHEVILVPSCENNRMEDFSRMVREVNETQVAPEDILSDHAYYYSPEEDKILY